MPRERRVRCRDIETACPRKRSACPRAQLDEVFSSLALRVQVEGVHFRFSLRPGLGRPVTSRTEAAEEAERLRLAIRAGAAADSNARRPAGAGPDVSCVAEIWKERRGDQLVRPRDNVLPPRADSGVRPARPRWSDDSEHATRSIRTGRCRSVSRCTEDGKGAPRARSTTISSCCARCSTGRSVEATSSDAVQDRHGTSRHT